MNSLDQRTAAANRYFEWPVYWSIQFICATLFLILTLFQATRMVIPYWSTMQPMQQFVTAMMLPFLAAPWIAWLVLDRKLRVLLEGVEIAQPRLAGTLTGAGRLAGTHLAVLVSTYTALFFGLVVSGRILRTIS